MQMHTTITNESTATFTRTFCNFLLSRNSYEVNQRKKTDMNRETMTNRTIGMARK